MDEIKAEAIKLRLDKLFNGQDYFSVCDVDSIAKLIGCNAKSHESYSTLSALHCVKYKDMSNLMKSELPNMVMACLTAKFDTDFMASTLTMAATNRLKDDLALEKRKNNIFRIGR